MPASGVEEASSPTRVILAVDQELCVAPWTGRTPAGPSGKLHVTGGGEEGYDRTVETFEFRLPAAAAVARAIVEAVASDLPEPILIDAGC